MTSLRFLLLLLMAFLNAHFSTCAPINSVPNQKKSKRNSEVNFPNTLNITVRASEDLKNQCTNCLNEISHVRTEIYFEKPVSETIRNKFIKQKIHVGTHTISPERKISNIQKLSEGLTFSFEDLPAEKIRIYTTFYKQGKFSGRVICDAQVESSPEIQLTLNKSNQKKEGNITTFSLHVDGAQLISSGLGLIENYNHPPASDISSGKNGLKIEGTYFFGSEFSHVGDVDGNGSDDFLIGEPGAPIEDSQSVGRTLFISRKSTLAYKLSTFTEGYKSRPPLGTNISALGDINGDGFDDFVLTDNSQFTEDNEKVDVYVVLGNSNLLSKRKFLLNEFNQENGFKIEGLKAKDPFSLVPFRAGDINNDGFDDIIVTEAESIDKRIKKIDAINKVYLILGKREIGKSGNVNVNNLGKEDGFTLTTGRKRDLLGRSISGGSDINGDNIDDLVIGDPSCKADDESVGCVYILFGSRQLEKNLSDTEKVNLSMLNNSQIQILKGTPNKSIGSAISTQTDFNSDGINDVVMGASFIREQDQNSGKVYVLFGQKNMEENPVTTLENLKGQDGFCLVGMGNNGLGDTVFGGGDINGDGVDDLFVSERGEILSVTGKNSLVTKNYQNRAHVIFGDRMAGKESYIGSNGFFDIQNLNGKNGFTITTQTSNDGIGSLAALSGDMNADGIQDLVITAPFFNSFTELGEFGGAVFFIWGNQNLGKAGFPGENGLLDLSQSFPN